MLPDELREHLLGQGISRRVVEAMMTVPRDRFVPSGTSFRAWEDHAMSIGHGQTISQPTVVAIMTQAADIRRMIDRVFQNIHLDHIPGLVQ